MLLWRGRRCREVKIRENVLIVRRYQKRGRFREMAVSRRSTLLKTTRVVPFVAIRNALVSKLRLHKQFLYNKYVLPCRWHSKGLSLQSRDTQDNGEAAKSLPIRWLNKVMQDHEARASDLNRKLIFSFFLLFC